MPDVKLDPKRERWATTRKEAVLKGTRLNYNAGLQIQYVKELTKLIKKVASQVVPEIRKFFATPEARQFLAGQEKAAMDASVASQARILTDKLAAKFNSLFGNEASKLAEKMVKNADKISTANLQSSLKTLSGGLTLNTKSMTQGTREIAKASIAENVALIKSIGSDYLSNVQKAVMRSITVSGGLEYLIPQLNRYEGISQRHAKNMALDQTRKAYNAINKGRMQAVGVKKFEWVHSGGGQKPRASHIALSGKVFSFSKEISEQEGGLPVINKEQVQKGYESPERGIPGQAINCKCTMIPVIEFDEGDQV